MSQLDTLFRWGNDLLALRSFYTHLLQLEETYFRDDDEHGWLSYQLGDVQLVFMRPPQPLVIADSFAINPAYKQGTIYAPSAVIRVSLDLFPALIARLQQANIPAATAAPFSNRPGHFQYVVRDPMGNTLEIYAADHQRNNEG